MSPRCYGLGRSKDGEHLISLIVGLYTNLEEIQGSGHSHRILGDWLECL
jgi:hypothetical protein